jgi:hypothetical protein
MSFYITTQKSVIPMSSVINRGRAVAFVAALAASSCSSSSGDGTAATPDAAGESAALGSGGSGGMGGTGATGSGGAAGSGAATGGAAASSVLDASVVTDGAAGSGGSSVSDASNASDTPVPSDVPIPSDVSPNCLAGDPTQALQLRLGYRTDTGFTALGAATSSIALTQAPQGGQVLFVGVEARNVAGCTATIATALVDTQTQAVVSLESRPIFLDLASDGWLAPLQPTALSNYSNLPACPRASLTRSIDANTYQLRVNLTDASGRMAQASIDVVPTCPTGAANALCHCQCAQGYMLGMVCN